MIVKELIAKLGFDVDQAGFSVAEQAIASLRGGLLGLGGAVAAVAAGLAGAAGFTIAAAGEIDDLAVRTGLTTTAIQELSYAAEQSGSSLQSIIAALEFVSRNANNAATGNKEAADAFKELGISIRGTNGELKSADDLMGEAADRIAAMEPGTKKSAAAMKIFGRSAGPELIQLLNQGSEGIKALKQEAHDLGGVMGEDLVSAGDTVGDNFVRITWALKGLRNAIAGPLVKALADLTERFVKWIKVVKPVEKMQAAWKLLKDHIVLVASAVTLYLLPAMYSMAANWLINTALANGFGLAAVRAALSATAAWLGTVAPIVLLALLIEDLYYFFTEGESVIGDLGNAIVRFIDDFTKADPSDSIMMEEFKALVALIFDITDPAKWSRLAKAFGAEFKPIIDWVLAAIEKIRVLATAAVAPFKAGGEWLNKVLGKDRGFSTAVQGAGNAIGSALGNKPEARPAPGWMAGMLGAVPTTTPGFSGGAASIGAAATGAANQSTVVAPTFNASFAITTQPGQSNEDIARTVQQQLEEYQLQKNREAFAAVGG